MTTTNLKEHLPKRDLYIDKELSNQREIEQREGLQQLRVWLVGQIVLLFSSVSCIYGLNAPETFLSYHCRIHVGQEIEPIDLVRELVELQYEEPRQILKEGRFAYEEKTRRMDAK